MDILTGVCGTGVAFLATLSAIRIIAAPDGGNGENQAAGTAEYGNALEFSGK
jgi:hypothetical protein